MSSPKHVPPPCRFDYDRDKLRLKLDQVVPSDIGMLEEVVGKVIALIALHGCSEDLDKVELALHEALANAIVHGNRSDPNKSVRVCVAVGEDCGLLIVVKDAGNGFDPATLPNPLDEGHLLRPHGRGLFLINQLMDDVRFSFDWGTAVHMRRRGQREVAHAVALFSLPGCAECACARRFLEEKGVAFSEHDVLQDEDAMRELLRLNYSRMPVIVIDGQAVAGFDPVRLEELLH